MKNIEKTVIVETGKNKKKQIIAAVAAFILVISGGIYYFQKTVRQNRINDELNKKEVLNDIIVDGKKCYDRNDYFVITRADVAGSKGEDILVKYKTDKHQKIDCDYKVAKDDFELLNTFSGLSNSQFFSNIKDNHLIVNKGAAFDHVFKIYDLDKREIAFGDDYSGELLELKDSTLTYWRITNDISSAKNCAKYGEYQEKGVAVIEGKVSLDIANPIDKKIEEFRCLGV
jgi:hypothetical protein